MDKDQKPKRALIEYRIKPLAGDAKWSAIFQREIDALDSGDAMTQFYGRPTWPALTGTIEVKGITWDD